MRNNRRPKRMENVRFGRRFFVDAASGLRYDEYENTGRRINAWGLKSWASRGRSVRRRYEGAANWGEWWENGWFETLEKIPALPFNGDAYIGARREAGVHWIGMLFPAGTAVPEGFEFVDLPPADYAVCFNRDAEGSAALYSRQTREACLERIAALGLRVKEGWRLERYNCPRFTTPDERGRVVLDWAVDWKHRQENESDAPERLAAD